MIRRLALVTFALGLGFSASAAGVTYADQYLVCHEITARYAAGSSSAQEKLNSCLTADFRYEGAPMREYRLVHFFGKTDPLLSERGCDVVLIESRAQPATCY